MKNVWRVFIDRLNRMRDPLHGAAVSGYGYESTGATVGVRDAILRYLDERDKVRAWRAGAEMMVFAHGQDGLVLQQMIIDGEMFEVELPEDAFDDEEEENEQPQPLQQHAQQQQPAQPPQQHQLFEQDDDTNMV